MIRISLLVLLIGLIGCADLWATPSMMADALSRTGLSPYGPSPQAVLSLRASIPSAGDTE